MLIRLDNLEKIKIDNDGRPSIVFEFTSGRTYIYIPKDSSKDDIQLIYNEIIPSYVEMGFQFLNTNVIEKSLGESKKAKSSIIEMPDNKIKIVK